MKVNGIRNNRLSNSLIKWGVIVVDFLVLWIILYFFTSSDDLFKWGMLTDEKQRVLWLVSSVAMVIAEYNFSTVIHRRRVGADEIIRNTTMLALTQTLATYLLLRAIRFLLRVGWHLLVIGLVLWVTLLMLRFVERWLLKQFRSKGYNTRSVTLLGTDPELLKLYNKLTHNATQGYKLSHYYGEEASLPRSGSLDDFFASPPATVGDELYLCVSCKERDVIERTAQFCDSHVVKFYFVRPSDEILNLQPLMMDGQEVYVTHDSPLEEVHNAVIKRIFDIVLSLLFLLPTALLLPFIVLIIKRQSPGPVFFRQLRTGVDGRDFYCYKFRSMHVNADSDRLQATKDDPRKFPFGDLMRKTNIDELPQFWNVLRGDMSIVGPRPHMLAHTEQYSRLISKYMVRHFVKPGITGWAQVTGFRGETRELWQMEGRVERDIWYMQNWSFWLDLRIIWMTVKTIFYRDKNAY